LRSGENSHPVAIAIYAKIKEIMMLNIDKFKQSDGTYLDEQGTTYFTEKDFLGSLLGFGCMCGNPDAVFDYVRDILRCVRDKDYDKQEVLAGSEGAMYFTLYHLDELGLIEHGTSVRYSWLTDEGKELLEDLETVSNYVKVTISAEGREKGSLEKPVMYEGQVVGRVTNYREGKATCLIFDPEVANKIVSAKGEFCSMGCIVK